MIKEHILKNQNLLDIDFVNGDYNLKVEWFELLVNFAMKDLSLAHITQHNHTARLTLELTDPLLTSQLKSRPYGEVFGTSSVAKFDDSCSINNSKLSGKKLFVSGMDSAEYHTFWISGPPDKVVYVRADAPGVSYDTNYSPIGMEGTRTGNLIFDNVTDFKVLTTISNPVMYKRLFFHNLGFCAVNLGLCRGLVEDFIQMVDHKNISMLSELKVLSHAMNCYENLFYASLPCLQLKEFHMPESEKLAVVYSEGKRVLMMIIEKYLMYGDSRYTQSGQASQRFRDALTYVTHRNNFYNSLSTVYGKQHIKVPK
jgi:hypothetical protein